MDGSTAGVDEVAEPVSKQREEVILKRVSKVSVSLKLLQRNLHRAQ